jgi:hypothetical protein
MGGGSASSAAGAQQAPAQAGKVVRPPRVARDAPQRVASHVHRTAAGRNGTARQRFVRSSSGSAR